MTSESRPRIWFVCPTLGAASEPWMWRQASGMDRADVEVVCWERQNPDLFPMETVHVLPFPRGPRSKWERWAFRLRNAPTGNFYGAVGREKRFLERLVSKRAPAAALCHYGPTALRLLPVAKKHGLPVVAHFNGMDLSYMLSNTWYDRSLRGALQHLAGVVVVAHYMRDWMRAAGMPEERIHYIPYGAPLEEFRPSTHVADARCRFLAVGRFVGKKAPDLTLRAFARCIDAGADAELTMIGEGPMRSQCEALAKDLDLDSRVKFPGVQPKADVINAMMSSSVFVQHSVTSDKGDKEGWPVAIAEAAACALPIVATNHADIPQQVEDGVAGYLVDEHDWQSMGDRMADLAKDASLRQRMSAATRARIEQIPYEDQVRALEDVLLRAAAEGPP